MCVIVDANLASVVFGSPAHPDFAPVIDWLHGEGRLVYGGQLTRELEKAGRVRKYLLELNRAGRALPYPDAALETEARRVRCRSNDPHVIALARVSGARTLCSRDTLLHADFKDAKLVSSPRGMVYQSSSHRPLLRHTASCGRLRAPDVRSRRHRKRR